MAALIVPIAATFTPAPSSERRATRPLATPSANSAASVQSSETTSAVEMSKIRYGQSGMLEDDRQLRDLAVAVLDDLLALLLDLGAVEALLGLAREVRPRSHRDGAGEGLGQAGDDDQRLGGVGGGHAGDDPERHEQAVLRAQHDLADARQPGDAGRLAERVLVDVDLRLGAARSGACRALPTPSPIRSHPRWSRVSQRAFAPSRNRCVSGSSTACAMGA